MGLYDSYLGFRLRHRHEDPPQHIALSITERDLLAPTAYDTLEKFFSWAVSYDVAQITVAVSVLDQAVIPELERELRTLRAPMDVAIRGPEETDQVEAPIQISIGMGGKQEFTDAVYELATDVEAGTLSPHDIDEEAISRRLTFAAEPDLLIKTGAERLSDFAIWQSVYSELYFCDVNWRDFRKRDLLRAMLDFQDRQRRFGH